MNMTESVLDVPEQEVITKDNAMVTANGIVFLQVMDAAKVAYEVSNLTYGMVNLATTNLRTVLGSMDLDEVLSKRDIINAALLSGWIKRPIRGWSRLSDAAIQVFRNQLSGFRQCRHYNERRMSGTLRDDRVQIRRLAPSKPPPLHNKAPPSVWLRRTRASVQPERP